MIALLLLVAPCLFGRVQEVDGRADYDVQVVDRAPDIEVHRTRWRPTKCGEWQWVDKDPDFTVRFVERFPDLRVKWVNGRPR